MYWKRSSFKETLLTLLEAMEVMILILGFSEVKVWYLDVEMKFTEERVIWLSS